MKLKRVGEDRLIERLARRFTPSAPGVIRGIGDDTAVTAGGKGCLLSSTDTLVEGTHFALSYTPPRLLGRKLTGVSLSDIAAMGGEPLYVLVSLALPGTTGEEFFDELYRGIRERTARHGVTLVGGNTSSSPRGMVLTCTALGEAEKEHVVYRSGAGPGEVVYVTGTLGDAALGLKALRRRGTKALREGPYRRAARRHLDPVPRLAAGAELARRGLATAMIDVSDGLVRDLGHIASESEVGARVEAARVPLSGEMKGYLGRNPSRWRLPLTGGEDYELLFTAPADANGEVKKLARELRLRITAVGQVLSGGGGVEVLDPRGRPVDLVSGGFEHFRPPR